MNAGKSIHDAPNSLYRESLIIPHFIFSNVLSDLEMTNIVVSGELNEHWCRALCLYGGVVC